MATAQPQLLSPAARKSLALSSTYQVEVLSIVKFNGGALVQIRVDRGEKRPQADLSDRFEHRCAFFEPGKELPSWNMICRGNEDAGRQ